MRYTETYQRVKATGRTRVQCNWCGKWMNRQRTFTMTINPFNKNEDGTVRTPYEVHNAVNQEAWLWEQRTESMPHYCQRCERDMIREELDHD
jgi:hypothetical protein